MQKWHVVGFKFWRSYAHFKEMWEEWIGLLYDLTGQVPETRFADELVATDRFVAILSGKSRRERIRHLRAHISHRFYVGGLGLRPIREKSLFDSDPDAMFQAHVMRLAAQEKASVRAKEIVKEAVKR